MFCALTNVPDCKLEDYLHRFYWNLLFKTKVCWFELSLAKTNILYWPLLRGEYLISIAYWLFSFNFWYTLIKTLMQTGMILKLIPKSANNRPSEGAEYACWLWGCTVLTLKTEIDRKCQLRTNKQDFQHTEAVTSLGITVCHHSASLMMPNGDPREGFFYPTLTLMIDSYILYVWYST